MIFNLRKWWQEKQLCTLIIQMWFFPKYFLFSAGEIHRCRTYSYGRSSVCPSLPCHVSNLIPLAVCWSTHLSRWSWCRALCSLSPSFLVPHSLSITSDHLCVVPSHCSLSVPTLWLVWSSPLLPKFKLRKWTHYGLQSNLHKTPKGISFSILLLFTIIFTFQS